MQSFLIDAKCGERSSDPLTVRASAIFHHSPFLFTAHAASTYTHYSPHLSPLSLTIHHSIHHSPLSLTVHHSTHHSPLILTIDHSTHHSPLILIIHHSPHHLIHPFTTHTFFYCSLPAFFQKCQSICVIFVEYGEVQLTKLDIWKSTTNSRTHHNSCALLCKLTFFSARMLLLHRYFKFLIITKLHVILHWETHCINVHGALWESSLWSVAVCGKLRGLSYQKFFPLTNVGRHGSLMRRSYSMHFWNLKHMVSSVCSLPTHSC